MGSSQAKIQDYSDQVWMLVTVLDPTGPIQYGDYPESVALATPLSEIDKISREFVLKTHKMTPNNSQKLMVRCVDYSVMSLGGGGNEKEKDSDWKLVPASGTLADLPRFSVTYRCLGPNTRMFLEYR